MDFEARAATFQEADRRYAELKRRHDAGEVSDEEFDEQRRRLMVRDEGGRWWAKSRETGEWHYYDGTAWIKDTPPGTKPPQATRPVSTPSDGDSRSDAPETTSSARSIFSPFRVVVEWGCVVLVALL